MNKPFEVLVTIAYAHKPPLKKTLASVSREGKGLIFSLSMSFSRLP